MRVSTLVLKACIAMPLVWGPWMSTALLAQGLEDMCQPQSSGHFWSLNDDGSIQGWTINGTVITPGSIVLQSHDQYESDLALSSIYGTMTFITSSLYLGYLYHYDQGAWVGQSISNSNFPSNMAGGGDRLYYVSEPHDLMMRSAGSVDVIENLAYPYNFMADPVVASNGDVMAFMEEGGTDTIMELRRYSATGDYITSYPAYFGSYGFDDAFLLEDTIYLAFNSGNWQHPNTLIAAWIAQDSVFLGAPIPFNVSDVKDFTACAALDVAMAVPVHDNGSSTTLWPNPAVGMTTVALPQEWTGEHLQMTIRDVLGRVVEQRMVAPSNGQLELDWSAFANGRYHLQLDQSDKGSLRFAVSVSR